MTEAEPAIKAMFQTYLDGYNELDAEKLAGLHANPTIMVHCGEVFTLTDDNNVAYHESILAENAAEEHVWKMADIKIDQVAPYGGTAKLHWIAKRPDGSLMWEDCPAYLVADDGWLIWGNISSNT